MASLVFVYPESRDHYTRGQYKLLAIAETAAMMSKNLSRMTGRDVLIEPRPSDDELRAIYRNRREIAARLRAFMPSFQEMLEVVVLSSPELEVDTWEELYHAKRDIDAHIGFPAGVNDLILMAKVLRLMEDIGEESIFLRNHGSRPGPRKR